MPDDASVRPRPASDAVQPPYERGTNIGDIRPVVQTLTGLDRPDGDVTVRALEGAVEALREQLAKAEQRADADRSRADRAERHLEEERGRVDEERKGVDELRAALADAVAAERIAVGEASALRAESDHRRSWGVLRRLRGK